MIADELAWVIDPNGVERYIPITEVEIMSARNEVYYCEPDLDFGDSMDPHWHKYEAWEDS